MGRTVADVDSEGEGEEYAEVEDMECVRGIVSCVSGRAGWSDETSYFCKGMMDALVEGALATPSADVELHFLPPVNPNRAKQSKPAAATSHIRICEITLSPLGLTLMVKV